MSSENPEHSKTVVWLPAPSTIEVIKRGCRVPSEHTVVDLKPIALPDLSEAEAPLVVEIQTYARFEQVQPYRRWNGDAWRPPLNPTFEHLTVETAGAAITAAIRDVASNFYNAKRTFPEFPFDEQLLAIDSRGKIGEPIELEKAQLRETVKENLDAAKSAAARVRQSLIVIDNRVYIRAPEPLLAYNPTPTSGILRADYPTYQGIGQSGTRSDYKPWLSFRINEMPLIKALSRAIACPINPAFGEIRYSHADFEDQGFFGCSAETGLIEIGHGLVSAGRQTIGFFPDASLDAFKILRRAIEGTTARPTSREVLAVPAEKISSISEAIIALGESTRGFRPTSTTTTEMLAAVRMAMRRERVRLELANAPELAGLTI